MDAFEVLDELGDGQAKHVFGRLAKFVEGQLDQLRRARWTFRAVELVHCGGNENQAGDGIALETLGARATAFFPEFVGVEVAAIAISFEPFGQEFVGVGSLGHRRAMLERGAGLYGVQRGYEWTSEIDAFDGQEAGDFGQARARCIAERGQIDAAVYVGQLVELEQGAFEQMQGTPELSVVPDLVHRVGDLNECLEKTARGLVLLTLINGSPDVVRVEMAIRTVRFEPAIELSLPVDGGGAIGFALVGVVGLDLHGDWQMIHDEPSVSNRSTRVDVALLARYT